MEGQDDIEEQRMEIIRELGDLECVGEGRAAAAWHCLEAFLGHSD